MRHLSSTAGGTESRRKGVLVALLLALVLTTFAVVATASATPSRTATAHQAKKKHHKKRHHKKKHHRRVRPRQPGPGNVALFNTEAYHVPSAAQLIAEAPRLTEVVLMSPDGDLVAALHRANPRLQVYVYQFIVYANSSDPTGAEMCTTVPQAQANNWFLRGPSGQIIAPPKNPSSLGVDPGIPSYQHACANHAVALARQYGFNGVFLDGVGAKIDYQFGGPVDDPKYPTVASWQSAMYSFLQVMSSTVHASGLKVIANIGGSTATPGLWESWSSLLDGSEEESWTDGGLGIAQQIPAFAEKLANVAWSEAHHKDTLLHSYNTTESANVFGLASMLLVADGYTSYATANSSYTIGQFNWFPEYATAQSLGLPTGNYVRLGNGLYMRRFSNGVVVVNPTFATAGTRLGGTYTGDGYGSTSAISLAPLTAAILLRR